MVSTKSAGKSELDHQNLFNKVVHKLRLQDEVGKWSKNVHFLSMFIL